MSTLAMRAREALDVGVCSDDESVRAVAWSTLDAFVREEGVDLSAFENGVCDQLARDVIEAAVEKALAVREVRCAAPRIGWRELSVVETLVEGLTRDGEVAVNVPDSIRDGSRWLVGSADALAKALVREPAPLSLWPWDVLEWADRAIRALNGGGEAAERRVREIAAEVARRRRGTAQEPVPGEAELLTLAAERVSAPGPTVKSRRIASGRCEGMYVPNGAVACVERDFDDRAVRLEKAGVYVSADGSAWMAGHPTTRRLTGPDAARAEWYAHECHRLRTRA